MASCSPCCGGGAGGVGGLESGMHNMHQEEAERLRGELCRARESRDTFERELHHFKASQLIGLFTLIIIPIFE